MNFQLQEFKVSDVIEGANQSFEVSAFPRLGKIHDGQEKHNKSDIYDHSRGDNNRDSHQLDSLELF